MAEGKFIVSAQNKVKEGLDAAKKDLLGFQSAAEQVGKSTSALTDETKNLTKETGGLSSATSSLSGVFGGFVVTAGDVANAVKAIYQAAASTIEAFREQEKSVAQFSAAMSLSGKITKEQADGLRTYADEMEALTGVDGEAILSMEAFLASSGRNEAQIRKLINAAADYSAATGKDMRASVEELNKTFSGSEGRIGQLIPALKDLTDEQLKAGAGIDVVAAQYKGFAAKMSGIADVELKNFKLAYDDVLAKLGEEVWPAIQPAIENVTKFVREKLIPGIGNFFDVTVAIFENIPEVAKKTFQLVNDIIRLTFSWEGMSAILEALGENIINAFSSAFSVLPDMFLNIIGLMFNPITQLGLYIGDTLSKAFSGKLKEIKSPGEYLSSLFTMQVEAIGNIANDAIKIFTSRFNSTVSTAAKIGEIYKPEFVNYWADVMKIIQPTLTQLQATGTGATTGGSTRTGTVDNNAAAYAFDPKNFEVANVSATFRDDLSVALEPIIDAVTGGLAYRGQSSLVPEILGAGGASIFDQVWAQLLEELQAEFSTPAQRQAPEGYAPRDDFLDQIWPQILADLQGEFTTPQQRLAPNGMAPRDDFMDQVWGSILADLQAEFTTPARRQAPEGYAARDDFRQQLGLADDLRPGARAFANNGNGAVEQVAPTWLDKLGAVITPLVDKFGGMLKSVSAVAQILDPVTTILSAMFEVISPVLNELLTPIVGILNVIGSALGDMLVPILEALSPVIEALATAFVWLYNNVIVPVGNLIYSMMATVWNGIAAAINFLLGWLGVSLAYMDTQLEVLDKISLDDVKASGESTVSDSTSTTSASYASQSITVNIYQQGILIGDDGMATLARTVRDEIDYLAYKGR